MKHRQAKQPPKPSTTPIVVSTSARQAGWWWLAAVFLVVAVWAVYRQAPTHGFVSWDDPVYVSENPTLLRLDAQTGDKIWTQIVSNNYHPVTMWSLWKNIALSGMKAGPIISTNIWIHALNSVLVLIFAAGLSKGRFWVAFGTAALFALHPMHVESVAWVSERKDVLYVCFALLALLAYQRSVQRGQWWWLGVSLVCFLLSCLSKAMAVVVPVLMLLVDYWEGRSWLKARVWVEKVPFFALSLLFGLIALDVQKGGTFGGRFEATIYQNAFSSINISFLERLKYIGYGLSQYVVKLIAPTGLCTYYPYPSEGGSMGPWFPVGVGSLLVYVGTMLWAWLKDHRALFFGLAWCFVSVAMVLQVLAVGSVIMADRYTYLAHIGLGFAIFVGLDRLAQAYPQWKWTIGAAATGWVLGLAAMTPTQVATWKETVTLWNRVLELHPNCAAVYAKRGQIYGKEKRDLPKAKADLDRATQLNPNETLAYEGLGIISGMEGNSEGAAQMFSKAIALKPTEYNYYFNRAIAYSKLQKFDLSIADFEQYQQLYPAGFNQMAEPYFSVLFDARQYQKAVAVTTQAIERQVSLARAYLIRAYAQRELGNPQAARADAAQVLKLDAANAAAQALLNANQ
jgi:protein O-mannosyl-transferase